MRTFENHQKILDPVPSSVVRMLGALERGAGEAAAKKTQHADALKTLVEVARIQSTEASNAIEDITAAPARLKALMQESTAPADRSEAQIAGYRYVLDLIHASADAMSPFSENLVKQLHGNLYRFTTERHAGDYKIGPNDVTETRPDGTEIIRFQPVAPAETRTTAMPELHRRFNDLRDRDVHHPLLLIAAYGFDFLMIHPFQDGNGRTARLITLLLLYQAGYEVGRYISLERLINESRETYYGALARSTEGWHEGKHTLWPWVEYLLGTFVAAYKEFDDRMGIAAAHGTKQPAIRAFIRSRIVDEFTITDVRGGTTASDSLIKKVLGELQATDPPAVEIIQRGRYARYRRLHTDF